MQITFKNRKTSTANLASDFRRLLSNYHSTSKSDEIRNATADLVVAAYSSGLIDRAEYRSALAYL